MGIIGQTYDSALGDPLPSWLLQLLPEDDDMSTACACWKKYATLSYTQFAAAALTKDIEAFVLPQRGILHAVAIIPKQSSKGGAIATYKISLGPTGDFARYATAFDVFQAPGDLVAQVSAVEPLELINLSSVTSIRAKATSTVANLDQANQGITEIYALVSMLPS